MNNETSTPPRWGQYWMEFIRQRAGEAEVQVCVSDMFDDGWKPHASDKVKLAIANPEVYPFIDISQVNSRNFQQDHWDRFLWVVRQLDDHPRPLNHVKIYSDGQTRWGSGTPKDGVERFWRNLIGGAASCRFHRPGGGIGLNETAKRCIRSARLAESLVKFWDVEPRMDLVGQRESNEAYLAAKPGEQFLLYFTDGGEVTVKLGRPADMFRLKWINVKEGSWGNEASLSGADVARIRAPATGGWVAVITAYPEH
jgi:hypothetical protein